MDTETKKPLRVWNVINPPNKPNYYPVDSPEQAHKMINELAQAQLKEGWITSNAFGLEVFEDGEWCEWYNDYGDDIDKAFES